MNCTQPISGINQSNEFDSQSLPPTALVLQICSVDAHSAMIDVSNDYLTARAGIYMGRVIGYRILFKKQCEIEYQQKELRQQVHPYHPYHEINGSQARLMLSGLVENTEYVVKAIYEVISECIEQDDYQRIWSDESELISFCTVNISRCQADKAALITSFCLRTIIKNPMLSHVYLVGIITEFFVPKFQWNPAWKHEELTLSNNGQTLSRHGKTAVGSILSQNVISKESAAGCIVRWEMTMIKKEIVISEHPGLPPYEVPYGSLVMGWIGAEHINEVNVDSAIEVNRHAVAFGLVDGCYPRRYINGGCGNMATRRVPHDWQDNDRMELQFDFETGSCAAYHNGNFIGLLTYRDAPNNQRGHVIRDLPKEFYLVATVGVDNCVFDARLFQ